ncbi:MAG TPA: hypothetical protein PKE29_18930 [Phycisphaerales bacterium]|nr:hypothetical protein [Phycisphaerales bacterium]
MPIPQGSAATGLQSGTDGSRAYFADLNAKIDRAAAAAVLDPIDKRTRHLLFFNPDPEVEQRIFRALSDPYSSLATIAIEQHTSVEGLSAWMARPDIAQRIFHVRSSAAAFVSVASTMRLQHAMRALSVILCEYTDAACHAAGLAEGRGASPGEHIRRDRETARKACQLLMRLANFNQSLRSPTNPDIRTPNRLNTSTPDVPPVAAGSERQPVPATTDAQDQAALLANIKDLLAHLQNPTTNIAPTANPEPAQSAPSVPSVPSVPSAPSALYPDP